MARCGVEFRDILRPVFCFMRLRQKASNRRLNPGSTHNGFSADLLATLKAYPHRGIFLDDDLFDIGANTRPAAAINDGLQEMVGNLFRSRQQGNSHHGRSV